MSNLKYCEESVMHINYYDYVECISRTVAYINKNLTNSFLSKSVNYSLFNVIEYSQLYVLIFV